MCELCEEAIVVEQAMQSAMTILRNRADEGLALPTVVQLASNLAEQLKTIIVQQSIIQTALTAVADASNIDHDGKAMQDVTNQELVHALALAFMTGVEFGRTGREICTWKVDDDHDH